MASVRKLEPMFPFKGCTLDMFIDDSKPVDSPGSCWSESTYDGKPESELFDVPPHWHKLHDEYWTVLEGEFEATIDGKKRTLRPSDGEVHIPRRHVHGLKSIKGVRAVLREHTDPCGQFKEAFFRDLMQKGGMSFWLAMRVFYDGDAYPAFGTPFQVVDQVMVTILGGIAKLIAPPKYSNVSTKAPVH